MTLELLKSEVLKLKRAEMFDFVQFVLQSLKEKETEGDVQTPDWLKIEISKRAAEMKSGDAESFSGEDIYQEIINKHGFDIPTTRLS